MTKYYLILWLYSLLLYNCNNQDKRPLMGATDFQKKLNATFKDASKTPLKKKDLKIFKGLDFFPIDSNLIVVASFTKINNAIAFKMKTTTNREANYKEYGVLNFTIDTLQCQLTIYQSQDDIRNEEYKDYLFLPFTDETSGDETYGGGRYLDVMISDIKNDSSVVLNFNNTYNPYCAYNEKYSCPLTPRKNHIPFAIKAGVKEFKKIAVH